MKDLATTDIRSLGLIVDIAILSHWAHLIVARLCAPGVATT